MKIEIGKKYEHRKGGIYVVITTCKHVHTFEELVVYYSPETKAVWARSMQEFCDGRFTEVKE